MHDLYFTMGAQSLRAGRSILSGPVVLIDLEFAHLTRELLVGLNEPGHRRRQIGVGGGECGTGPHQFSQNSLLPGRIRSKGVKLFVEVIRRPDWIISSIWYRRLPKCAVSSAKLVWASNGLLLELFFPFFCPVHIFPGRTQFFFLGKFFPDFIRLGEIVCQKHGVCCDEEEGILRYGVLCYLGTFLRISSALTYSGITSMSW